MQLPTDREGHKHMSTHNIAYGNLYTEDVLIFHLFPVLSLLGLVQILKFGTTFNERSLYKGFISNG